MLDHAAGELLRALEILTISRYITNKCDLAGYLSSFS